MVSIPKMSNEKLIIIMVGLPARGKSYITKKISNYFNFLNINNKIFNVGQNRRLNCDSSDNKADFFNPNDKLNVAIRDELAIQTLDDLVNYLNLDDDNKIGIFDATNSTIKRRQMILTRLKETIDSQYDYKVLFLESICNDDDLIESNMKLKLNGPDYKHVLDKNEALSDFKQRLMNYSKCYQTVDSLEFSNEELFNLQYLKIVDVVNLEKHNINGFLPIILNNFLQNFNIYEKKIWLTLNHIDYKQFELNKSDNFQIFTNEPKIEEYKTVQIPNSLTLDKIHDLILKIEAKPNDCLIQSDNQFLINAIFKYYNIYSTTNHKNSSIQLNSDVLICINPHRYTVEIDRFEIDDSTCSCPLMTRSNSTISTSSCLLTPNGNDWEKFNYQNLNLPELSNKLLLLDESLNDSHEHALN